MAKNEKKAVNPMKDGPEDDVNEDKVVFESEELAKYAADEYDLDLAEMVGTGKNGVITAEDVDKAITEAEETETVNFASEDAGEFYAENEEVINLDEVEGTGAEGAITVDDMKKVMPAAPAEEGVKFTTDQVKEAAELAVKDHGIDLSTIKGTAKDGSINAADVRKAVEAVEEANAPAPTPSAPEANEGEAVEEVDEIKSIIDDLVSFGLPVRGTLKNKPKVLERWLDLQARAVKAQRAF